jgi:hypothetical protein
MILALLAPNFMPSFGKIVGAVFEICRHARANTRTDGAYFIDPFDFQSGPRGKAYWSPESHKAKQMTLAFLTLAFLVVIREWSLFRIN